MQLNYYWQEPILTFHFIDNNQIHSKTAVDEIIRVYLDLYENIWEINKIATSKNFEEIKKSLRFV